MWTYRTAPSHGFEGREAIFLKGLPTTIATVTRSYLKRIFCWDTDVDTLSTLGSLFSSSLL